MINDTISLPQKPLRKSADGTVILANETIPLPQKPLRKSADGTVILANETIPLPQKPLRTTADNANILTNDDPDISTIGNIPMPTGFRYKKVFARGKPQHPQTDIFRIRHPSMAVARRAKIFAPFDALKGFSEAVAAKDELYENRRDLSEEDLEELNRRMNILRRLTLNTKMVRANPVSVSVTYYVPCSDVNSDSHGIRGQYRTITGVCRKVDPDVSRSIMIDDTPIPFRDIYRIEGKSGIF